MTLLTKVPGHFVSTLLLLAAPAARAAQVAGAVVLSDKWETRRAPKMEEEFVGDVRYSAGPSHFRSDWALFEHDKELWKVRGQVRLQRRLESGDTLTAYGDEGWFTPKGRRGELHARQAVRLERQAPERTLDTARGRRAEWREERVSLDTEVRVEGPRLEASADRADYELKAERLDLSGGRPALLKHPGWDGPSDDWRGALVADQASAWRAPRRLAAEGRVRGWLQFPRSRRPR